MKFGHDEVAGKWCDESCGCEPAGKVGFEGIHVGGAGEFWLTGNFVGDVVREEGVECRVEKEVDALLPDSGSIGL